MTRDATPSVLSKMANLTRILRSCYFSPNVSSAVSGGIAIFITETFAHLRYMAALVFKRDVRISKSCVCFVFLLSFS